MNAHGARPTPTHDHDEAVMQLNRQDTETEHVLTAGGEIGLAELAQLRAQLVAAVGDDVDLLLDAREVTAFDAAALPALTAARSRAKHLRRRLAVLDREDGAVTASLRRSGLRFRFPVFPDAAAAHEALVAERAELESRAFGPTAAAVPLSAAL